MRSPISSMRCSSGRAERSSRRRALQTMWRDCPKPCAAAIFSSRIRTRTRFAVLEITGKVLKAALERSAEYFSRGEDGRLCVSTFSSGRRWSIIITTTMLVSYVYDISLPVGERVTSMRVNGQDVREEDTFTIWPQQLPRQRYGAGTFLCRAPCRARDRHGDGGSDLDCFKEFKGNIPAMQSDFRVI